MRYGVNWQVIDRCVGANLAPVHPGELLTDWLDDNDVSASSLADSIGVQKSNLSRIKSGRYDVGPKMALRLEHGTGVAAEIWLHLQMSYTLARLRKAGQ